MKITLIQYKFESPVGPLHLVASSQGLKGIYWKEQKIPSVLKLKGQTPEIKIFKQTIQELKEYFIGQRKKFEVPLDVEGTEFQRKVWNQLKKIPYGKTFSYQEIATQIKHDKAIRAVGTANGRNPLSIIIPCHRVIASDGTLAGYAGGLDIKSKLLILEKTGKLQSSSN